MPSTLKREDEIDKQANGIFNSHPGLKGDEIAAGKASTENSAFDDIVKNYDQNADPMQENTNIARAKEQNPSNTPWTTSTDGMGAKPKAKISGWRKRSAGILITLGLVGGGVGVGFITGPATMLVNLMENLANNNDSSSVAMERRFLKVFGKVTIGDPVCRSTSKNLKCKFGRISNKALKKLEKKGVYAIPERTKSTGYPDKNPTHYRFDGHPDPVPAGELRSFLAKPENRDLAAKVLGRGGAFNVRFAAWRGKHMKLKFWDALKLSRDGGHADGKNADLSEEERREKLQSKVPETGDFDGITEGIKTKIEKRLGTAKKGGTAYLVAASSCITVKAPRYIAAGVAAVQLAQIVSMVNDDILSPGSKLKANAIENNVTPDDVNFLGTTLTEQTKNSEGKMTSATDSKLFKQALGIEKNKVPTNMDYAPGGSVLASPFIIKALKAEKSSESSCNAILSPEAMYTAAGVDAAVTVAASATIIGGIIKVIASFAASEVASKIVAEAIENLVPKVLASLAKSDKIPSARGEPLGDILGLAGMGFFSSGGMAHHLPTLKTSQLASYDKVRQDSENFQREMDIASLSPFDTSSQYTFLGSIVHNTQTAMIANGANTGKLTSLLSSVATLPALTLSPKASADTGFSQEYCGYAKDFGMSEGIAINASGTPCTGLTEEQADMSTDKALKSVSEWIDDSKEVADDATIEDLVNEGVIKEDTPLRDYIDTCSNPATGDYLFNSSECALDCTNSCAAAGTANPKKDYCPEASTNKDEDGKNLDCENVQSSVGTSDTEAVAAIPTFLIDYQLAQSINSEDEEPKEGQSSNSSTDSNGAAGPDIVDGGFAWPLNKSFYQKDKSDWLGPHTANTGTAWGGDNMGTGDKGSQIAADVGNPPDGTHVFAMFGGTVTSTDLCSGSGEDGIAIKSTANGKTLGVAYMHGTNKQFKVGDTVKAGDYIMDLGEIGCNVDGGHVHFGVAYDGKYICPQDIFLALEKNTLPDFDALTKKAVAPCGRSV